MYYEIYVYKNDFTLTSNVECSRNREQRTNETNRKKKKNKNKIKMVINSTKLTASNRFRVFRFDFVLATSLVRCCSHKKIEESCQKKYRVYVF